MDDKDDKGDDKYDEVDDDDDSDGNDDDCGRRRCRPAMQRQAVQRQPVLLRQAWEVDDGQPNSR